jgi:hypothetical protein
VCIVTQLKLDGFGVVARRRLVLFSRHRRPAIVAHQTGRPPLLSHQTASIHANSERTLLNIFNVFKLNCFFISCFV